MKTWIKTMIIATIILIIIGCNSPSGIKESEIAECEKLDRIPKISCYTDLAVKNNDTSVCLNLEESKINICIHNTAINKKDASYCEDLVGEGLELANSKSSCILGVARVSGDASLCKTDYCIEEVALATLNEDVCEASELNLNKEHCYLEVAQKKDDHSICEKAGDFRKYCYARFSPNPLVVKCEKIIQESDDYYKQFLNAACSDDDDCTKIQPLQSCWACVSKSIDSEKISDFWSIFNEEECYFNEEECYEFDEFSYGCPSVATWCGCIDGTCQTSYNFQ